MKDIEMNNVIKRDTFEEYDFGSMVWRRDVLKPALNFQKFSSFSTTTYEPPTPDDKDYES